MMDWMNGNVNPQLVTGPEDSLSFLYNCNYDYYPGIEMNYPMTERSVRGYRGMSDAEKKKRLTNEQLEYLENSFIEDQKLEPERKTKLARELGLQPRQVAVWFQNRRARWKAKELERSYDALKCEYDVVFKEKKRLQEEVLALKMMLRERAKANIQFSSGHREISGEEMMESTSTENPCPTKWHLPGETNHDPRDQIVAQTMYGLNGDEYNSVTQMPSFWSSVMPSYP